MIAATLLADLDEDWIVCLRETRTVLAGHVACPMRSGQTVAAANCTECHLLTWMHDEREWAPPCTTGPHTLS